MFDTELNEHFNKYEKFLKVNKKKINSNYKRVVKYYSKGYNKTTKQQVHPQQQQHTQPYTAMQYGNASNVHKTSKLPLPPYQYAKTSSEYGAFLNYGDFE